jgi:ATP synthase F1 gamma subunit
VLNAGAARRAAPAGASAPEQNASFDANVRVPPLFEPDRASLLGHLLPIALESQLQQAMFNSIAGEIAARRAAMDSATDNATTLIAELTLKYNRERQAAITKRAHGDHRRRRGPQGLGAVVLQKLTRPLSSPLYGAPGAV